MSLHMAPVGVSIVHQYYPGFIDMPANSQYIIRSRDLTGSVQVLAHVRPLVVTDFNNELVSRTMSRGRRHTDIRRKITGIKKNSLTVDASGFEGRAGPAIAIEKDIRGRVFYQDVYTSLQFCAEFDDLERAENIGLNMQRRLLERFVGTYRYLNPDVRVAVTGDPCEAETPLWIGYYMYTPVEKRLPLEKRIVNAQPDRLRLSIAALGRGARALQSHVGDKDALGERAEHLGSYLLNGFALSENLLAVEQLADLAFSAKHPGSAVAGTMAIAQVAILQAQKRFESDLMPAGKICKASDITWNVLINKVLPPLLNLFDGDKGSMIKRATEVVKIRHDVVHENYAPSSDEANKVLSFVRSLLSILELPEQFKGNWKRK